MADFEKHITNYMFMLLSAHDIEATLHNNWVTVGGKFPAFRAFYERPQTKKNSGLLSVQIMLDEGSVIEESFAAIGDSHIKAISGALDQFAISMFHPIISACCDYVDEEHVTKETWRLKMFSTVDIWSGNIALRKSSDVRVTMPINWLTYISDELRNTKIRKGYNWITLYCSRLNSDSVIASAALNNADWPAGLEATTRLSWPEIEGFYGARLFIMVKR